MQQKQHTKGYSLNLSSDMFVNGYAEKDGNNGAITFHWLLAKEDDISIVGCDSPDQDRMCKVKCVFFFPVESRCESQDWSTSHRSHCRDVWPMAPCYASGTVVP